MLRHTSLLYQSNTAVTSTRGIQYGLGTTALPCAGLRVHDDTGAIEDVHEELVQRKSSVDLPGDVLWTLSPEVGEEHEHRGFVGGHGMVLDRENPYLRRK